MEWCPLRFTYDAGWTRGAGIFIWVPSRAPIIFGKPLIALNSLQTSLPDGHLMMVGAKYRTFVTLRVALRAVAWLTSNFSHIDLKEKYWRSSISKNYYNCDLKISILQVTLTYRGVAMYHIAIRNCFSGEIISNPECVLFNLGAIIASTNSNVSLDILRHKTEA